MQRHPKKALTPDQARERLRAQGKTVAQWARERGYHQAAVYRVIGGQYKAYYGMAHEIAVALGLKVAVDEPNTQERDCNMQKARVA